MNSLDSEPDPTGAVEVIFITRTGCHLCDVARPILSETCQKMGVTWVERDVSDSSEWLAAYQDEIPVVLINGQRHSYWSIDPQRLVEALKTTLGQQKKAKRRWW